MPAHSSSDPHEHGRVNRPKSSSTARRTNMRSKNNASVTGTPSAGKRHGSRGSKNVEIKQTAPSVTQKQEIDEVAEENKVVDVVEIQTENGENEVEHNDAEENGTAEDENSRTRFTVPESDTTKPETPPPVPEPEVFTLERFNNTVDNFSDIFSQNKYTNVTDDYPVEDLVTLVSEVTESIEEYKQQTLSSQRHLEDLRGRMHDVKEKIQTSVQKKTNAIRMSKYKKNNALTNHFKS